MASKKPGNEGGIQGLFAQHVEKIALGVAIVMVFAFLYMGMKHEPLPSDREAVALERAVKNAKDNVHESTWNQAWRYKEWPKPDFHIKAAEDAVNVAPAAYKISWLDPPIKRNLKARIDPRMMPVENLVVRPGVIAALASKPGAAGGRLPPPRRGGGADPIDEKNGDSGPPTLRQEQVDAMDKGFRSKDRGAQAVGKYFVSVRGIVPILDQQGEYERCFTRAMKDADYAKYAADRDQPKYIYAYIERQEVDAAGNPVPFKTRDGAEQIWTRMAMSQKIATAVADAWPPVDEPADERYLDANLTMPPPPVLLQDYVSLVMHPDVPLKRDEKEADEETEADEREEPGIGPGMGPGIPGPGGPSPPDKDKPGKDGEDAKTTEKPAEYRLFRYYDFNVDPAKRYRYRVQLLLEDPNHPEDPAEAPEPATLAPDVIKRIEDVQNNANRRIYWRETEWSEESEIVDFPPVRRVLAGEVDPGRSIEVPGSKAKIQIQQPEASVMALVWDADEAVWVPGVASELPLGSVVDFAKNVWVVDPLSFDPRRLPAYPFNTGYVVGGIYGGEMLPSENRKSKLTVPGEVLLIGEDGRVSVRSEFDDADTYSLFHYTTDGEGTAPPVRRTRSDRDDESRETGPTHFEDDLLGEG